MLSLENIFNFSHDSDYLYEMRIELENVLRRSGSNSKS